MPIYEFSCDICSEEFESLVRSSNWEGEVEKLLSVFVATALDDFFPGADFPPCSGMPSNCGGCALDN